MSVNYGPTNGGEYITPYAITIMYRTCDKASEAVCAALSSKTTQIIALQYNVDVTTGVSLCDHPSRLLVMCNLYPDEKTIERIKRYGFQCVIVFDSSLMIEEDIPETVMDDAIQKDDAAVSTSTPINTEYTVYGVTNIIKLIGSQDTMNIIWLLDIVFAAILPNYTSKLNPNEFNKVVCGLILKGIECKNMSLVDYFRNGKRTFDVIGYLKGLQIYGEAGLIVRDSIALDIIKTTKIIEITCDGKKIKTMPISGIVLRKEIRQQIPLSAFMLKNTETLKFVFCYWAMLDDDRWVVDVIVGPPEILKCIEEYKDNSDDPNIYKVPYHVLESLILGKK